MSGLREPGAAGCLGFTLSTDGSVALSSSSRDVRAKCHLGTGGVTVLQPEGPLTFRYMMYSLANTLPCVGCFKHMDDSSVGLVYTISA